MSKFAVTFGASKTPSQEAYEEGMAIGALLVSRGYRIKCGGYGGLMEAVSYGANKAGGEVIGITLEAFEQARPNNPYLSRKIVAKSLFERLELLIEGSELFIVQQGSIGTLNELFMVWAIKYALKRPFRIILVGGEYEALFECALIPKERLNEIEYCADIEALRQAI